MFLRKKSYTHHRIHLGWLSSLAWTSCLSHPCRPAKESSKIVRAEQNRKIFTALGSTERQHIQWFSIFLLVSITYTSEKREEREDQFFSNIQNDGWLKIQTANPQSAESTIHPYFYLVSTMRTHKWEVRNQTQFPKHSKSWFNWRYRSQPESYSNSMVYLHLFFFQHHPHKQQEDRPNYPKHSK